MRFEKRIVPNDTKISGETEHTKEWIKFGVYDNEQKDFVITSFSEAFIEHKVKQLNK